MFKLAPFAGRKAVRRALAQVGRRAFTGMCQAFTVTMFGTGAVGDYDGNGPANAVDGWKKAVDRGRVVHAREIRDYRKIPRGVALYWTGGSRGHGHAAVSIGGGRMVTTDAAAGGVIGVRDIRAWWTGSHTFVGYAYVEGNGFILRRLRGLAPKPSRRPKSTRYVVTAEALNVRQGPSTKTDVVKTIRRGHKVRVVGRRGDWLETIRGDFIHSAHARKI